MLELDALSVGFAPAKPAILPTSFRIAPGGRLLLCGANGSGKSTLLATAAGVIPKLSRPPFLAGSVRLGGAELGGLPRTELFRRVGIVFQNLDDQLWDLGVEDLIAFPLESRGLPGLRVRDRVLQLVSALSIEPLLGRRVLTLSGGERRMVALAAALATGPELLVLDEPTTGLDPAARQRLAGLLGRLGGDLPMLLAAEQDAGALASVADAVLLQKDGAADVLRPMAEAAADDRLWLDHGLLPVRRRAGSRRRGAGTGRTLIEATGLVSRLRRGDGRPVLDGVDLAVRAGEVAGLIGPNGTGKTTLFQSILGLSPLAAGRILLGGEEAGGWTVARRARRIAYVPQNVRRILFNLTVLDEAAFAVCGKPRGTGAADVRARAQAALMRFGLDRRAGDSPFALSAREQAVLGLACAAAAEAELVILDEPLLARDLAGRALLDRFLDDLRGRGGGALLVSHDLDLVDDVADRLLIMDGGKIRHDGPPETGWHSAAFAALGWPAPLPAPAEAVA
ncbi:ATP-binding cassette domain-containing protein [Inquilinus limosus]|uniref:ATP-binding cassette domain-containing protein n=1 Tax=Inquilinus limosus TaxID=171674 RepID=UPI000415D6FF|nr:ABC transporter ATP-binding protein [Inquilinus limosus]